MAQRVDEVARSNAVLFALDQAVEYEGEATTHEVHLYLWSNSSKAQCPFPLEQLSPSQLKETLRWLRKDGLVQNVQGLTRERQWLLTMDGMQRLDRALKAALKGAERPLPQVAALGPRSRPSGLTARLLPA